VLEIRESGLKSDFSPASYPDKKKVIERKELPGANYMKNNIEVRFIGLTL